MQKKLNRLAIISDCIHMFDDAGNAATENHIFCRQMQTLSNFFQHTIICCPFVLQNKKSNLLSYHKADIEFIQLPNAGGSSLLAKLKILKTIPVWLKSFKTVYKNADIIYQRFPNNLNIPGFFYFYFKKAKVFATYTGTWKNYKSEPLTYRFQKFLLKHFFHGPVWAYLNDSEEKKNIYKGFSPSYTFKEWMDESMNIETRIKKIQQKKISFPVFITVGFLVENKNQQFILNVFNELHKDGIEFTLHVVGDGPLYDSYKNFIEENNLGKKIFLEGKKSYEEVKELYRKADFLVQAPFAEGYGKVPLEGFFHGVIPLISNVGMASDITGNGTRGFTFNLKNGSELRVLIDKILTNQNNLDKIIENGRVYAKNLTLENWAKIHFETIEKYFEESQY